MVTQGAAVRASVLAGNPSREVSERTWDATAGFGNSIHCYSWAYAKVKALKYATHELDQIRKMVLKVAEAGNKGECWAAYRALQAAHAAASIVNLWSANSSLFIQTAPRQRFIVVFGHTRLSDSESGNGPIPLGCVPRGCVLPTTTDAQRRIPSSGEMHPDDDDFVQERHLHQM